MKNFRRYTAIILALLFTLSAASGCANKNSNAIDASNNAAAVPDTNVAEVSQPSEEIPISDDGYGRQEYAVGGLTFRVGDKLQAFADAGFDLDEDDLNVKLPPKGFLPVRISYKNSKAHTSSLRTCVFNDANVEKNASECRVVYVFDNVEVKSEGLFELGVTTKSQVESAYNSQDLMFESTLHYAGAEMDIPFENNLAYGSSFNHVKFHFDEKTNVIDGVQILYCDHILSEVALDNKTGLTYHTPISALSALAPYMDIDLYWEHKGQNYQAVDLQKKFNTKTLKFKLNDVELNFGESYETYNTLVSKGFKLLLDESDMEDVKGHSHKGYGSSRGVLGLGENIISDIRFGNPVPGTTVSWKDARFDGITIENSNAVSTENPNAPSFDFYGVTGTSTIQDVVSNLGLPSSVSSYYRAPHIAEMRYYCYFDSMISIVVTVDTINNNIYEIELITH